jgi:hypothetical protein
VDGNISAKYQDVAEWVPGPERGPDKIKVAHSGRVRVKVVAPVAAGDLLVASAIPGHAMRSAPREVRPGTILGKALEPLPRGEGAVLVLLTLQ